MATIAAVQSLGSLCFALNSPGWPLAQTFAICLLVLSANRPPQVDGRIRLTRRRLAQTCRYLKLPHTGLLEQAGNELRVLLPEFNNLAAGFNHTTANTQPLLPTYLKWANSHTNADIRDSVLRRSNMNDVWYCNSNNRQNPPTQAVITRPITTRTSCYCCCCINLQPFLLAFNLFRSAFLLWRSNAACGLDIREHNCPAATTSFCRFVHLEMANLSAATAANWTFLVAITGDCCWPCARATTTCCVGQHWLTARRKRTMYASYCSFSTAGSLCVRSLVVVAAGCLPVASSPVILNFQQQQANEFWERSANWRKNFTFVASLLAGSYQTNAPPNVELLDQDLGRWIRGADNSLLPALSFRRRRHCTKTHCSTYDEPNLRLERLTF